MKIKRVALIEPAVGSECLTTEIFAQIRASLPFLAGALKASGYECGVYCEELIKLKPRLHHITAAHDAVGISVTINTVRRALDIASAIKKIAPARVIVFGGSVAGNFAEKLLETGDYCLPGRAEITFPMLLDALNRGSGLENVPNLILKRGVAAVRTERKYLTGDFISDFGPVVNFGGVSENHNIINIRKPPLYSIFSSTGCVRNCRFCITEKKYVRRETDNALADFKSILSLHRGFLAPHFMLVDDCAFGDMDHLKKLLSSLAELRARSKFSIMMQFHVKPLLKDPAIALLMKKAGITTLMMGFESASDASLNSENKGTTVAENIAAIKICRKYGIIPYGYFVAGFDADTESGIRDIFDFISAHKLVAQVLPVGVVEVDPDGVAVEGVAKTLDSYSFGAAMKVSHVPRAMSPHELQAVLIEGYDRIYSFKRAAGLLSAREAVYNLFFSICYRRWRPRLVAHLNYLKLLARFGGAKKFS